MADEKVQQKTGNPIVTPYDFFYWASAVGLSEEDLKDLLGRAMAVEAANARRYR